MYTLTAQEHALVSYLYKNQSREAKIIISCQRLRLRYPDQPSVLPRLVNLAYVAIDPEHGGYYSTKEGIVAMEIYEET